VASRVAARNGLLYDHFDASGTLTSRPELRDRVDWALAGSRPAVFLLGDSVLGASALLERGEEDARGRAASRALEERASARGSHVVSLAADGLLPADLEAIANVLSAAPGRGPGASVVVVLNVRMFATGFHASGERLSRGFLAEELPPEALDDRARVAPGLEAILSARLLAAASRHVVLFRTTQLLRTAWYDPTPRDAFQRLLERAVGRPPTRDLEEAALLLRVSSYYRDEWLPSSPGLLSLGRLLSRLGRAGLSPLVVLSPQNPDVVEDADAGLFARNREVLGQVVTGTGATFRDLGSAFAAPYFLDHCHLTAPGNRLFAARVDGFLAAREAR